MHKSTLISPPPRPRALPTLVQYYCTIIGQYTTPLPTSRVYAIHHTILVISISCKGEPARDFFCLCEQIMNIKFVDALEVNPLEVADAVRPATSANADLTLATSRPPWMFRKTLRKVLRTYVRSPRPYTWRKVEGVKSLKQNGFQCLDQKLSLKQK